MGEVGLGQANTEVAPGEIAKFGPVKLKQDALKQIDKSGIQLLINVYSGRKSSPNNLLDCGIYEDALEPVEDKTIPITCKLTAVWLTAGDSLASDCSAMVYTAIFLAAI